MARRRGTSRVTPPGTPSGSDGEARSAVPPALPSLRERRPFLFWGLMLAVVSLVVPLFLGLFQAIA